MLRLRRRSSSTRFLTSGIPPQAYDKAQQENHTNDSNVGCAVRRHQVKHLSGMLIPPRGSFCSLCPGRSRRAPLPSTGSCFSALLMVIKAFPISTMSLCCKLSQLLFVLVPLGQLISLLHSNFLHSWSVLISFLRLLWTTADPLTISHYMFFSRSSDDSFILPQILLI